MDENPFQPPPTRLKPVKQPAENVYWEMFRFAILIASTFLGGLLGNLAGSLMNRRFLLGETPTITFRDFSEIASPLGLGLLIVGGILGGLLGDHLTKSSPKANRLD